MYHFLMKEDYFAYVKLLKGTYVNLLKGAYSLTKLEQKDHSNIISVVSGVNCLLGFV